MKKLLFLICFVVLLAFVSNASAATVSWWNGTVANPNSGDGLWSTAGNWSLGRVPSLALADKARIRLRWAGTPAVTVGPTISEGMAAEAYQVAVGDGALADIVSTLTVTGGTLQVGADATSWFIVGYGGNDRALFTVSGGTITASDRLFVGFQGKGTLDMTGGTLNLGGVLGIAQEYALYPLTSEGLVNLLGGTIYANDLLMNGAVGGKSNLIINDGFLVLNGDDTAAIDGWIGLGAIRTTIPGGSVLSAYDPDSMKTTVWAIPEPATICLLGIGALSLLRRRK